MRNTYRVLLTRGIKGVMYISLIKRQKIFFKSRVEGPISVDEAVSKKIVSPYSQETVLLPMFESVGVENYFMPTQPFKK